MSWQYGTAVFLPAFWFQHVNDVLAFHQVNITAVHVDYQIFVLKFRIKADDIHSTFSHVAKKQFHEITFALSAIAKYQDICIGFIIGPSLKVNEKIASILIMPDIKALRIGFAGVVEGIEIGGAGCWYDALELLMESIVSAGLCTLKSFFLS